MNMNAFLRAIKENLNNTDNLLLLREDMNTAYNILNFEKLIHQHIRIFNKILNQ